MHRASHTLRLRFLTGVAAVRQNPVAATFGQMLDRDLMSTGKRAVEERAVEELENRFDPTTRIGGAKVIAETVQNFYKPNEASPFVFVKRSPREAGLCPSLCRELRRLNIKKLTELQAALIPYVLRGQHMIAHAETGSGKSFGVMLAVANKIERDAVTHRMHTVIIVPTNELALQYDRWFKHFVSASRHVVFAASESIPIEDQLARLHNFQPHVLVGTAQAIGTIQQHARALFGGKLRRHVDTIILDEADVVVNAPVTLDGSFAVARDDPDGDASSEMAAFHQRLRSVRSGADVVDLLYRSHVDEVPAHIVAISATIDGATARMLNGWMKNDDTARVTTSLVEHSIPDSLTFYFWPSTAPSGPFPLQTCFQRAMRLIRAQDGAEGFRILVLTSLPLTEVKGLVDDLHSEGSGAAEFRVGLLEDDGGASRGLATARDVGRSLRRGNQQIFAVDESVISRLSRGILNVGIARFETARGLNIAGVTHVVLLGEPPSVNDFVHGAGRTGRNGRPGDVISVFPPESGRAVQQIAHIVGIPWKSNRPADVARLCDAAERSAGAADEAAKAVGEELRRRAAEALEADGTRTVTSKARLIELRQGRVRDAAVANPTAAAAVAYDAARQRREQQEAEAAAAALAEDLTDVSGYTSAKHERFAHAVAEVRAARDGSASEPISMPPP
eukprot:CAMPEP_0174830758 /NCGR_PEP_ID=MMETSP1114-20130205/2705_1 /TAXON_ID=312471 /ORGANISM="Neobodo designis, Strain CCAP 1951/1" /LENGTH=675 /DNA_ID=CAMNT_0016064563 /DNA_START=41 /DNA_END=2064 /DNA_ORIENTATION=+